MWLITTQGFYSAVEHRADPGLILVRCRVKADLLALDRQVPGLASRARFERRADYPWRALVTREEWTLAAARLAQDVDYDNFKDAVGRRQGRAREGVYHRVWSVLLSLEYRTRARDFFDDLRLFPAREPEPYSLLPPEEEECEECGVEPRKPGGRYCTTCRPPRRRRRKR